MATEIGTAFKQKFIQLRQDPATPRSSSVPGGTVDPPNTCCFELPALAELSFTNDFNNDRHGYLYFWPDTVQSATLVLQRITAGVYVDVVTITDSTLGSFTPFGTQPNGNIFGDKLTSVNINWKDVLFTHGTGTYRVVSVGTTIEAVEITRSQLEFCLQEWRQDLAERTVRIDWTLSGNVGDVYADDKKWDYGRLAWANQLRLPDSQFGEDKSAKENEYVKYQTGRMTRIKDSNVKNYVLRCDPLPFIVHRWIDDNLRFGDEILITDFNPSNPTPHTDKSVISTGGYEPEWKRNVLRAKVEIAFESAFQNHNHKRC